MSEKDYTRTCRKALKFTYDPFNTRLEEKEGAINFYPNFCRRLRFSDESADAGVVDRIGTEEAVPGLGGLAGWRLSGGFGCTGRRSAGVAGRGAGFPIDRLCEVWEAGVAAARSDAGFQY